ncbi:6697_t:CDS:1, partial [Racocetra persica]
SVLLSVKFDLSPSASLSSFSFSSLLDSCAYLLIAILSPDTGSSATCC